MINRYTFFTFLLGIVYIGLYIVLLVNTNLWINDLVNCFKKMDFFEYFIDHLNIMLFLALALIMSVYISKALYTGFKEIYKLYLLNRFIDVLKIKKFKNLVVIDTDENLAFNLFNKIVVSDKVLKHFDKKSKKSIFLHEKGHLLNKDSYKLLITNIIFSLFPKSLTEKFSKFFVLKVELEADKYATKFVDKIEFAKTLIKFKSFQSSYPMMNGFTEERLKLLLENKDVPLPKLLPITFFSILFIILLTVIFNICICGLM